MSSNGGGVNGGVSIQDKFMAMRRDMSSALIERDGEIDMALTAIVSREHCLFVGIPGTAKSLMALSLAEWMGSKDPPFVVLLTKYTTPEELYGPFSLSKLKNDIYERVTAGYMPEAYIAVIEEIWKASSAVINTMLGVLNEREFVNGRLRQKVPLKVAFATANEFPNDDNGGKELSAAFDRFLFRKIVHPIRTSAGLERLLWGGSHKPVLTTAITPDEIDRAASEAEALLFTTEAQDAYRSIVSESRKEGIHVGDRRLKLGVKACRATAYVSGGIAVTPDHLECLSNVLWDDPAEQPRKIAEIVGKIANPAGMLINSLLVECEEIIAACDPTELNQAAAAAGKLKEIRKRLDKVDGNGRADAAKNYVDEELKRIKLVATGKFMS